MVHITEVKLINFRIFRNEVLDGLDEHTNAVTGRNGHGKSTLFQAISFVLGVLNPKDTSDEGLAVSMTLNNSEGRFPIARDTICIRRELSKSKDQFFLNDKPCTRQAMSDLLESAGFSRSNPYYIVEQGKVTELATMNDQALLELLKEVAGTKVYEERRREALRIKKEADLKIDKIDEVISYVDERLRELEGEKEELVQYQELDKTRRALEYTIYSKKHADVRAKLVRVDAERELRRREARDQQDDEEQLHAALKKSERDLKDAAQQLKQLQKLKAEREAQRQGLLRERVKVQLELADIEERLANEHRDKTRLQSELSDLQSQIFEKRSELERLTSECCERSEEERQVQKEILDAERRIQELHSKQGRKAQFRSKEERDRWLREQIAVTEATLTKELERKASVLRDVEHYRASHAQTADEVVQTQSDLDKHRHMLDGVTDAWMELKERRDAAANQRKEQWRHDADIKGQSAKCRERLVDAERKLQTSMPKQVHQGLQAVQRIVMEQRIGGVHGPLIELFACDEEFTTAVEVTAGAALFHIVVDNDDIAARILGAFNRERCAGRVAFLPLQQLTPSPLSLAPERLESEEMTPLVEKLQLKHPMFEPAFQQVFGRTLVCKSFELAAELARRYKVNCITLDGDRVDRRGALFGGYVDTRHSKLAALQSIRALRAERQRLDDEAAKVQAVCGEADQLVAQLTGDITKVETERARIKATVDQLVVELRGVTRQQEALAQALAETRDTVAALEMNSQQTQSCLASLRAELGTPLHSALPDDERRELEQLTERLGAQLRQRHAAAAQAHSSARAHKDAVEQHLDANLLRRHAELAAELNALDIEHSQVERDSLTRQLARVEADIASCAELAQHADQDIDASQAAVTQLRATIDEQRLENNRRIYQQQERSKRMEKLLSKRLLLLQQGEELLVKIRDIGPIPASQKELAHLSLAALVHQLKDTNRSLKAFAHVNKKALDQYVTFHDQKVELAARKAEQDDVEREIRQLVDVLDGRKEEAIYRTLKQVEHHFADVFRQLVPDGAAYLVKITKQPEPGADASTRKRIRPTTATSSSSSSRRHSSSSSSMTSDSDHDDSEEDDDRLESRLHEDGSSAPLPISAYTGLGIRVSFSKSKQPVLLQQLSGGQKTMVALALIFAIQRCDPAPFYLFDEVDAALDKDSYIPALLNILRSSSTTQFIYTTFKEAMIDEANAVFKVYQDPDRTNRRGLPLSRIRDIRDRRFEAFA